MASVAEIAAARPVAGWRKVPPPAAIFRPHARPTDLREGALVQVRVAYGCRLRSRVQVRTLPERPKANT